MNNNKLPTAVLFLLLLPVFTMAQQADYKNPKLSIEQRTLDLLSRMTLEEKVAQLLSTRIKTEEYATLFNHQAKLDALFKNGVGMLNPRFNIGIEETIAFRNKLQDYMRTQTRLGIPVIFIDEGHHGLMRPGTNVFPQAIGMACSWDPEMVEDVYRFVAKEANARGTRLVLTPVVDVVRDPRWGRTGETTGEDPYLCGVMGSAMVRGFQGSRDGTVAPGHVAATIKHFAAYGQPEGGLNQAPANYSLRTLRESHMESFRICIRDAKPSCVMASYNEIDGIPSHASPWLLTQVLRQEWHYDGIVVSDWYGIDQLWKKHHVVDTEKDAALKAFKAGITVDLPYGANYKHLVAWVKEKAITERELDRRVEMILKLKFKLGLFEAQPIDLAEARKASEDPWGRKLALAAAERSMVLLKNDNNLLPIKKEQYHKIAVVGPCAATNYLGDYSGIPHRNVSLLEGLKNKVGDHCEILYAEGCKITSNGDEISMNNYQYIDKVEFPAPEENRRLIKEAVATAKQADMIIVAIGENEQLSREAWPEDHVGDNDTLRLLSEQEELVKAMVATGKPVLVYLMHARPLAITWITDHVPAILDGWYMGQEAGNAFANILFGDTSPSGKLTITYPRSTGQIPAYYNHKPSAQYFDYVSRKSGHLFPFGHGLSYTTFEYSNLRLSSNKMHRRGSVEARIDITNKGRVRADEIVQLYIRDKVSSTTRPVKELKGFSRVSLDPGETKTVTFKIDESTLSFWNAEMEYKTEPGYFQIMVGRSSADFLKTELLVVE